MTIPGIRSGPVTSAKARDPVNPAEVQEHDNLEHRRESIRNSTPSPVLRLQPQDTNHRDDPGDPERTGQKPDKLAE